MKNADSHFQRDPPLLGGGGGGLDDETIILTNLKATQAKAQKIVVAKSLITNAHAMIQTQMKASFELYQTSKPNHKGLHF